MFQLDQLHALPVVAGAIGAPVVGPPAAGPVVAAAPPVVAGAVAAAADVAAAVVVVVVVDVVGHVAAVPTGAAGHEAAGAAAAAGAHSASQEIPFVISIVFVSSARSVVGPAVVDTNHPVPGAGVVTVPQISFNGVALL